MRAARSVSCDRNVDRVKLMVSRHLLRNRSAAEIFEDDEITKEIEKAPLVEHPLDHDLEFRKVIFSKRLARDRAPRLKPLPARPERADRA